MKKSELFLIAIASNRFENKALYYIQVWYLKIKTLKKSNKLNEQNCSFIHLYKIASCL